MGEGGGNGEDRPPPRTRLVVGGVILLLATGALGLEWGNRVELSTQVYRPDLTLVLALAGLLVGAVLMLPLPPVLAVVLVAPVLLLAAAALAFGPRFARPERPATGS